MLSGAERMGDEMLEVESQGMVCVLPQNPAARAIK
jgi:hypothetical protein